MLSLLMSGLSDIITGRRKLSQLAVKTLPGKSLNDVMFEVITQCSSQKHKSGVYRANGTIPLSLPPSQPRRHGRVQDKPDPE